MVGAVAFFLRRTTLGYRLRLIGANEEAARHAGVRTKRLTVGALVASGGLAGLAGSSLILAGESTAMTDNFSANYGFDGIVVALLARNSPAGVIPAALLFAALRQGGGLMEARVGISSALVLITQGLVILLVAGSGWLFRRMWSVRVDATDRGGAKAVPAATMAGVS
jgi:simple sugar transport system permease protein